MRSSNGGCKENLGDTPQVRGGSSECLTACLGNPSPHTYHVLHDVSRVPAIHRLWCGSAAAVLVGMEGRSMRSYREVQGSPLGTSFAW